MNTPFEFLILASASGGEVATEWDSPASILFQLAIILFFVLLNGFFVAAEFALVKVRPSQLDEEAEAGSKGAKLARHMTDDLNAYLSAGQLGITLASLALGFLGEGFVASLIEPAFGKMGLAISEGWVRGISIGIAYTVVTFLHITLGEQLPKTLAIRRAVGTATFSSRPLHIFHQVFRPFIWLLNTSSNKLLKWIFRIDHVDEHEMVHTAEELAMLVHASERKFEVTATERDILINALELNELVVRDIMTPRSAVIGLDVEDTFEENWTRAVESGHTRFPLVQGHLDSWLGFVHVKDLMKQVSREKPSLLEIKRDLIVVPEMMPLDQLLRFFLGKHAHLALAVDEFGGTVGMVTLDNVVEELVGDIHDEFDEHVKPEVREISEGEYLVEGMLGLYELEEHLKLVIENADVSTVGGYVTHLVGHLPEVGEKVRIEDFEVTVTKSNGRRVVEVRFQKRASEEDFSPSLRKLQPDESVAE